MCLGECSDPITLFLLIVGLGVLHVLNVLIYREVRNGEDRDRETGRDA
jgi:hypothetical protein